ncbi:MAG: hypothetical protein PHN84_14045 [Desulfuromonadaceae bacterium]|nr:hypothetical protein [Desulfuromonadaceae bacterium]MDD2854949.1 hypothetical protein [Desulfuromonadaceae bacterium]
MRRLLWTVLLVLPALLAGCYHMRVESEPIETRVVTLPGNQDDVIGRISRHIEEKFNCRILEADSAGTFIITAPYSFITDTGFGQPPGGRKYYTQLKIEINEQDGVKTASISHYNFEIRTSYAFNDNGKVGTMYKHYPYKEYPGMFDLDLINREMDRVSGEILHIFQEYK